MKIGQNIKELRLKSDYTTRFMADELGITEEEYNNIENDGDLSLNLLEAIANRLSTTVVDIIELKDATGGVRNFFNNNNGNQGTIINIQGINQEEIRKAYKELYTSELKRVPLLEALLHQNNIKFDF
ncbi:XRE family transcriptional regulator [Chryseobacterium indologenes]|uniref:helix-turn-helix transcriptional regulator n=1 Tax=Chryseobacterium indologenes TaxID=253 RepID=UPI000B51504E|nr:helix-turn-helix transcriptional regulator [Chryseobacterium indologenes]ASE60685.1 XRE family transcriptional regulator [Chryseobacterium indologenes]